MRKYLLGKYFIIFIFCLTSFIFLKPQDVLAATNLLTNGDFATGDSTGWTVLENGGSGATFSNNTFATSYTWNSISQTIDLINAGYSAGELDAVPSIDYTVGTLQRFDHDGYYYLEYKLLAEDGSAVIASSLYGSSGSPLYLSADTDLFDTAYTFSGYGAGARYAYIKIAGQDGSLDWGGQYGPYFSNISISISDTANPTVSAFSPLDNTIAITTTANLVITFDENVDAETGGAVLLYKSDNTLIQTFTIPDAGLIGTGTNTITINPTFDLDEQTSYYVQIDATAFDDTTGNSYAGISDTTTWNFTTADTIAPTVTFDPLNGATGVATDSNIIITFNEAVRNINNSVIDNTNVDALITLKDTDASGTDIVFDATIDGAKQVITVNPTSDFVSEQVVYVMIGATVEDASDNAITASSATFTVADAAAPTISNISPSGEQIAGTASMTMSLTTNESATCKYSGTSGVAFTAMTVFTTTGTTGHSTAVSGLSDGNSYSYYIKCQDTSSNESAEATISFSVANGGGNVSVSPSPAVGSGHIDASIDMGQSANIGAVNSNGVNVLTYINSPAKFSAIVSNYNNRIAQNHTFEIINFDLFTNIVTIRIASEPKVVVLKLDETAKIDLDNDGVEDIEIKFEDIHINRAELTVISLLEDTGENDNVLNISYENKLVKYSDSFEVYLIENNLKRWIVNEDAFSYYQYDWNNIINIGSEIIFTDGDDVIKNIIKPETDVFTRDLKFKMIGGDIKELQKYLNNHGFQLSESGVGSPNNETSFFGELTRSALIRFQKANNITPAVGYFGAITKKVINK